MSYEDDSAQRAEQHRDNWKDEDLTWWHRVILEMPPTPKPRISPENGHSPKSSRQNERSK